jgi:sugar fermentation stimulation protein A
VIFNTPLLPGILIRRHKRFLAEVKLESGETVWAHCPNSGSMKGVNIPGNAVLLSHRPSDKRVLQYTWEMILIDFRGARSSSGWVGINTIIPNRIAAEAFESGLIPAFRRYREYRSEVKISEDSRIDFVLGKRGQCMVEVKNVTLVENAVAKFPDCVSTRASKHVRHLIENVKRGNTSAVLFVIQHHAAQSMSAADDLDPEFGKILRKAATAGVKIEAWKAEVTPKSISLSERVNVYL